MYRSAIIDELGHFICWCSEYTETEIDEMLDEHPEWECRLIQVGF